VYSHALVRIICLLVHSFTTYLTLSAHTRAVVAGLYLLTFFDSIAKRFAVRRAAAARRKMESRGTTAV
jgi:hypothetical protein